MSTETRRPLRAAAALTALAAAVAGAGWYLGDGTSPDPAAPAPFAGGVRLVAFPSCDDALRDLKTAALAKVTAWGLDAVVTASASDAAGLESARSSAPAEHSQTTVHEAGVDEPDLVKTDGRRIVSVAGGTVRIVDPATRAVTALDTPGWAMSVLLHGDRALVLAQDDTGEGGMEAPTVLSLLDLAGAPRVAHTLSLDGGLVDARMAGGTAHLVLRSGPRLPFVVPDGQRDTEQALAENRALVEGSGAAEWLPHRSLDGGPRTPLVDCASVHRPADYTGTSLLSIVPVDLGSDLAATDSLALAADGDTVYGTPTGLYVADDRVSRTGVGPAVSTLRMAQPSNSTTGVHQFDTGAPGKPVYLASGSVPGGLLNQYSLSEHEGRLRVATTAHAGFDQVPPDAGQPGTGQPGTGQPDTGHPEAGQPEVGQPDVGQPPLVDERRPVVDESASESAVTVLERRGGALEQVGQVRGLGRGETIHAVRFQGDKAYVVTFRRTDPLYAVDLSDPAAPRVTGELKITGFSAYLHPVAPGRLLGVGQEATEDGRTTGTQVSLFDVSGPAPTRIAQVHAPGAYSEVESDPHAFLHHPQRDLVVVPVTDAEAGSVGALVFTATGDRLEKAAEIANPVPHEPFRRVLVVGDELWSFSGAGAAVTAAGTWDSAGWVRF